MSRGTIEERCAYFRARRYRRLGWTLALLLALTHRPYSASFDPMMTNLAKGDPAMTLIPNELLGSAVAALLAAALLSMMLLYVTRRANPQALVDQITLVRAASWAISVVGALGFLALLAAAITHGWS